MAAERMQAIGLTTSCPAISGAEPWIGSYRPQVPSPSEEDGTMPMLPVISLASSERMSPNIFSVTMTSNCAGFLQICMAQLSTNISLYSTSGYSACRRCMTARHRRLVSSTLALSTQVSFLRRFIAVSKPMRPMRSISCSE